jgi:long-chain acyl-CoA synthetase
MATRPKAKLDPSYPRYPTILHALDRAAREIGERPGLIVEDRTLSYAQYRAAVAGMARHLEGLGARGRPVAVAMANGMESAVALLGAMAAGAMAVPINPNYTDSEIVPLIRDTAPHVLFADAAFAPRAARFAGELGIAHCERLGPGGRTIDAWANESGLVLPLPDAADWAVMFFTGGTTGVPKGAPHRHANLMAFVLGITAVWPLQRDTERILNVAPLFHVWGFCFTLVEPIYLGATMVLLPAYKPAAVLGAIERHRITIFAGGPSALYVGMRGHEHYGKTDFSSLRYGLSGGAPCPEELLTAWQRETGSEILEGIGMSEGAPIASNPIAGPRKLGSVGISDVNTEIEIVDLAAGTRVLPDGEAGEIRVRGAQFITAYRNRPEETARAIREGWLYTGDIGYFDADGYLFVVDRKKEMILVGGYNVYPREIDELLTKHPAVHEAATVGVPDAFHGEVPRAYVSLRPGAAATAHDLLAYCRQHLAKYKIPKQIVILDALPKSSVGKINKLELKARE